MFIFQTFFFALLCQNLIKEIFLLNLISLNRKKILEIGFLFYFLFVFFCLRSFPFFLIFLLLPLIFLLFFYIFLKYKEKRDLLLQFFSLLAPLESKMKLGLSFINAWQKELEKLKPGKTKNTIQKITEILKFKKVFYYPDKEIEIFVKNLMNIYQSSNPLKQLQQLQRKVRVEQSFRIKSYRTLLQIRIQSIVLSFFYFGLLVWTFQAYGSKYIYLTIVSFFFFCIGLFWIFKTGRNMKWSV